MITDVDTFKFSIDPKSEEVLAVGGKKAEEVVVNAVRTSLIDNPEWIRVTILELFKDKG